MWRRGDTRLDSTVDWKVSGLCVALRCSCRMMKKARATWAPNQTKLRTTTTYLRPTCLHLIYLYLFFWFSIFQNPMLLKKIALFNQYYLNINYKKYFQYLILYYILYWVICRYQRSFWFGMNIIGFGFKQLDNCRITIRRNPIIMILKLKKYIFLPWFIMKISLFAYKINVYSILFIFVS